MPFFQYIKLGSQLIADLVFKKWLDWIATFYNIANIYTISNQSYKTQICNLQFSCNFLSSLNWFSCKCLYWGRRNSRLRCNPLEISNCKPANQFDKIILELLTTTKNKSKFHFGGPILSNFPGNICIYLFSFRTVVLNPDYARASKVVRQYRKVWQSYTRGTSPTVW
jgi:hypothetical protein